MNKQDKVLNNLATNLSLKLGEAELKVSILSIELQEAKDRIVELEQEINQQNKEEQ